MASAPPHMVLFPFMSKGHTIPILHLARLLLHRGAVVTIFTTAINRPFISDFVADTSAAVVDLPFPADIDGIPAGVESTDKLPSMSLFVPFAKSTAFMQQKFEETLETLKPVTCIISDGFFPWTLDSASKLNIPRLAFYGMNYYSMTVSRDVVVNRLLSVPESDDEPFAVPRFPWIKLTRNDFDEPFNLREPKGPYLDFTIEATIATSKSYGLIMNSWYELEATFVDHWNRTCQPRAWPVGPLCLAQPECKLPADRKRTWLDWLDRKLTLASPVLYVAFGSQAELSPAQLREIAKGLEGSKVNFLWVVRDGKGESGIDEEFEERVKERGLVVRDWVEQKAILGHEIVQGFLSHCGWNSVLESLCARVPILAWPMMAEQHLNARMVVEELKVGLRVETWNGSVRGFVKKESLERTVREMMEGEKGKEVRKRVKELGESASKAVEEGGSSWRSLNQLVEELQQLQAQRGSCQ